MNGKRQSNRRLKNRLWFTKHGPAPKVPCHWCGKLLWFGEATVDHEPPLAEGGDKYHAVLACWDCNQARGRATERRLRRKKLPWWRWFW